MAGAAGVLSVITYLLQLLNFPLPIPHDITDPVTLVNNLSTTLAHQNFAKEMAMNPNPPLMAHPAVFDFIVVGGGSAGAIVANRLSANPKYSVLLLEAGGDPTILNSIPGLVTLNMHQTPNDWNYKTIQTKEYGWAFEDGRARWTRHKALGGCSSHNWMIYNRGHPKDFDNWANLTGDVEWDYDHLLTYFKRLEDYGGRYPSDEYHGKGGPFHVSKDDGFVPSVEPWNAAAKEMGYEIDVDFNSRQRLSFGRNDIKTTKDGSRMSTFAGYIKPVLSRPNFKVIRYAHVHRVELDESNRATGVIYKRNGELVTVKARKEIVLSAGSINTPQILMLSGIGPKEHLKSVGVTPKVDLPGVGAHLEDHSLAFVGPFILDSPVSYLLTRNLKKEDAEEYARHRTGFFSSNPTAGLGYITSSVNKWSWSDVQVFQFHYGIDSMTPFILNQVFGFKKGLIEKWLEPYMGQDANFGLTNLGIPKSAGTIRLASNNPEDKPIIDPNYYDHPDDMKAQVDGIKFLVEMYEKTEAWGKYGAHLAPTKFPGCEQHEFKTYEYYECLCRQGTTTLFHPSGTAKMGKPEDPMAVVDTRLRVRGVKGLRVADASIMPQITNANLNTPTLMVGEKGADLILSDHINSDYEHTEL